MLDMSAAPAWLAQRRWFGGKGAPIAVVRMLDEAPLSPELLFIALEVTYASGAVERYAVPLEPGGGWKEALTDDAAARALLELVRQGQTVKTSRGELRGERFGGFDDLPATPAVRRLSAEQSNT